MSPQVQARRSETFERRKIFVLRCGWRKSGNHGTAGRVSLKPFLLVKKPIPTIGTPFLTTYTFVNPKHRPWSSNIIQGGNR